MVTWTLDIVKDNLEEETEKLKVQLKNPVNAVLGSPQKTVIYIVNLHRGLPQTVPTPLVSSLYIYIYIYISD